MGAAARWVVLTQDGPNVEPVQLQVVCQRLWDKWEKQQHQQWEEQQRQLQGHPPEERKEELPPEEQQDELPKKWKIEIKDLADLGDVNTALALYYDDKIASVAKETGVRERRIREWFDRRLITTQGIRGQVLQGPDQGLDLKVISALVDAHLVREDKRRGATWFELAHDRLIDPVRSSNTEWFRAKLSTLQVQADAWERQGQPDTMLFRGKALTEAKKWAKAHPEEVTENSSEERFLQKCLKARRQTSRIWGLGLFLVLLVLVLAQIGFSAWQKNQPWGYLQNISTGTVHELKGDTVSMGRTTVDFHNQIDLRPRGISRIHFFITRELRGLEMRSLNGTTVNARFLPYGQSCKLQDGDILVIAGIAPFQITNPDISLPTLGRLRSKNLSSPIPGTWGMLVDGKSRGVTYLNQSIYSLSLDEKKSMRVNPNDVGRAFMILEKYIGYRKNEPIDMIKIRKINPDGKFEIKYKDSDYNYPQGSIEQLDLPLYYEDPEKNTFETVGSVSCLYDGMPYDDRAYNTNDITFQIVPIVRGLELQKKSTHITPDND